MNVYVVVKENDGEGVTNWDTTSGRQVKIESNGCAVESCHVMMHRLQITDFGGVGAEMTRRINGKE